jgi:Flp pilus assembly protein TadG
LLFKRRREEGQAMVEFALVLPVLLLVLLAIMKFGLMFENYLTLTDAVRSGARQLAIDRGTTDACTPAVQRVQSAAAGLNIPTSSITYTLSGTDTCLQSTGGLTQGNAVTIKATYPCDLKILGFNFMSSCTLSASATERVE